MKLLDGLIEIEAEYLNGIPYFWKMVSLLILIILVLIAIHIFVNLFRKELFEIYTHIKSILVSLLDRPLKHPNWIAVCKENPYQWSDREPIDLKEQYLKQLSFEVELLSGGPIWRAGLMLGNPKFSPHSLVDQDNAITCHTGEPPPLTEGRIWIFDKDHGRNNAYDTPTVKIKRRRALFEVNISNSNHIKISIEKQNVYSEGIDPNFRKKIYLLAWGDENDCRVKFSNIRYKLFQ